MKNNKIIKNTIILLIALLVISLTFLSIIYIYNYNHRKYHSTVSDNIITTCTNNNSVNSCNDVKYSIQNTNAFHINNVEKTSSVKNIEFSLNNKHTDANTSFEIKNMFPGDKYEKYYDIQLSQKKTITINFISENVKKSGNIEKVLNCKLENIDNGEVVYEGTIENLHKGISYSVYTSKSVVSELHYKMTIYLDENVGNQFQQNYLTENFIWKAENKDALGSSPLTGDISNIVLFATIFVIAIICIILLLVLKKRRTNNEKRNNTQTY